VAWVALAPRAPSQWTQKRSRIVLRLVKAAPPPDWEQLLALADAQAPTLARAVLAALTWEDVPNDVRQALLAGNGVQAAALLTLHVETQMNAVYAPAVQQVAESLLRGVAMQQWDTLREILQALEVPSPIPTTFPRDLIAPRAIEAFQREGLRRVQGITTTTMEALRPPLMEGIAQGIPTPRIARELVPKIGLTTPQARALDTYAESLEGLPEAKRQARIERKAMQLRRKRAMTIARNETHTVLVQAQQSFWEAAAGLAGVTAQLKRFWTVARDERLCDVCRPIPGLNPEGVAMTEPFRTPAGTLTGPPAHVQCRCVVGYRPAGLAA
jgi:Phage Mu protein F like protein